MATSKSRFSVTKLEILIVVSILVAMAALVGPQLTNAAANRREVVLADQLRYLRTQVLIYRAQHNGVAPGYPGGDVTQAPSEEAFVEQMTRFTSVDGRTSDFFTEEFRFGPYLQKMPVNPFNESPSLRFVEGEQVFPRLPEGEYGWIYKPGTCSIAANTPGEDAGGVAFMDY